MSSKKDSEPTKAKTEKRDTRQSFYYPDHGVSVLAETRDEADELLAEQLGDDKTNDGKESE